MPQEIDKKLLSYIFITVCFFILLIAEGFFPKNVHAQTATTACSVLIQKNNYGYLQATVNYNPSNVVADGYPYLDWELQENGIGITGTGQNTQNVAGGGSGSYTVIWNYPNLPLHSGSTYTAKAIFNGSTVVVNNTSCQASLNLTSSGNFVGYVQGLKPISYTNSTGALVYLTNSLIKSCSDTSSNYDESGYQIEMEQNGVTYPLTQGCSDPNTPFGGPSVPAFWSTDSKSRDTKPVGVIGTTGGNPTIKIRVSLPTRFTPKTYRVTSYADDRSTFGPTPSGTAFTNLGNTSLGSNTWEFSFPAYSDGNHRWITIGITAQPPYQPQVDSFTCGSDTVPTTASVGTPFSSQVTVTNSGSTNWLTSLGYQLAYTVSQNGITSSKYTSNSGLPVNRLRSGTFDLGNITITSAGGYTINWWIEKNGTNINIPISTCSKSGMAAVNTTTPPPDPLVDLRVDTQSKTVDSTTFAALAKTITISSTDKAYLYWRTTGLAATDTCLGSWVNSLTKNVSPISGDGVGVGPYSSLQTLTIDCYQLSSGKHTSSSVTVNISGSTCAPSPNPANIGDPVSWTAVPKGGTPPYTFLWSGSGPLEGLTGNPVAVKYFTSGLQTGSVTITDSKGVQSPPIACADLGIGLGFIYSLAKPADISVYQGSSGSNSISLNLISGTSQPVSVSVSGLPQGASPAFPSGSSCSPGCSKTLTIATSASTPPGTVPVTVVSHTQNLPDQTQTFNLTVNSSAVCPGTCGPAQGPASQFADYWNGTCLDTVSGKRGWWSWDNQPATSSCADSTTPYCFTCLPITQAAATPVPGISLPATVRQKFSGPLLWGKILKDSNFSGIFNNNSVIGTAELNNSLLAPTTGSSVTASGGPTGSITAYTPNVMRGPMYYSVSYSGNHVSPAYLTRTFGFSNVTTTTSPQPVLAASTTTTSNPPSCYISSDQTTTTTTPVDGFLGVVSTNIQHSDSCCSTSSCTYKNETKLSYSVKTPSDTPGPGTTIQAMPNYQTLSLFAGTTSSNYTPVGIDGNSCGAYPKNSLCYSGCATSSSQTCQPLSDTQYSSCQSSCTSSCSPSGYTFSCATSYKQSDGWTLFKGSDVINSNTGSTTQDTAYGFKKTGVQQAWRTYSGLKITSPISGPTEGSDPAALFDDSWTDDPQSPTNPYCHCEQDPYGNSDCTGYGWTCDSLPARRENRFLPPGPYVFKIPSSHQMNLTVKVDGGVVFSGTASPGADGKLNFNFSLPDSAGSAVEITLASTFTDPNNLPAISLGSPELYPLGYFEASFATDPNTAFDAWCASGLDMSNKPVTWPNLVASQTSDNYRCTGINPAGLTASNFSTSLDSRALVEADLLLGGKYNSVSGQYFLDANLNGIKDSNESYLSVAGTPSAAGLPGYVVAKTATGYSIHNMKPGSYAVNFVPDLPYRISLPAGIAGFNVTVGPSCAAQTIGANIGQCTAQGDIINLDFGISPTTCAWIQTFGGDVHSNTSINTPCGPPN